MEETQGFKPKSFAVIGAGPVGCIVAAYLTRAGFDVTLCDVVSEMLAPALDPGIIIEGAENFQQKVTRTITNIDELAETAPDVIFVAIKAQSTPFLAAAIQGFHQEGSYVISWQNGIDSERSLADALGRKNVMRAVVNWGCGLKKPGHVIMPFHHPPHFIQELDPESKPAAVGIAEALSQSGLHTETTDEITSKIWRKSILNACMNPVCAVTGFTMAEAMGDPIVFKLVDSLIKECVKIARANEVSLGHDFYPYSIAYMKNAGSHKPSMLMDIENKRRTEIDFINGMFIEYGEQAGIETPYNITIRNLVKALESKY